MRLSPLFRAAFAAIAATESTGCLAPPEPTAQAASIESAQVALEVVAYDHAPAAPLQVPRRPRLRVRSILALELDPGAVALLHGAADDELLADLERAPLATATTRGVPCEMRRAPDGIELVPLQPLDPNADHTLVVAPWLRDASGQALDLADGGLILELHTRGDPEAGARIVGTWPADGAVDVGTSLPAVALAFDGRVENLGAGAWLEGPDGLAHAAQLELGACADLVPALVAPYCARLVLRSALVPLAEHRIVVGSAASDGQGAPVGPYEARFRTASGVDRSAPAPSPLACAVDESRFELGCAAIGDDAIALRVAGDEPFVATVTNGERVVTALGAGSRAQLTFDGLAPDTAIELDLALFDSSGNALEHRLALRTRAALATVSIVELRPDPLGAEPAQELIELVNYGERAIELAGMYLGDSETELGTALPRFSLAPAGRVLLVPDAFDASDTSDGALPPSTPLLRVGPALGQAGLANRGERVFLRDAAGARLSSAPSTPKPRPGVCLVRVAEDPRTGEPGSFAHDVLGACTPGR